MNMSMGTPDNFAVAISVPGNIYLYNVAQKKRKPKNQKTEKPKCGYRIRPGSSVQSTRHIGH